MNTTDINDIQLNDNGAGMVGWGDSMQIVGPLGNASEAYAYWDKSMDATGEATGNFWANDLGEPVEVNFAPGAGFAIDNPNGYEFNITIDCK